MSFSGKTREGHPVDTRGSDWAAFPSQRACMWEIRSVRQIGYLGFIKVGLDVGCLEALP